MTFNSIDFLLFFPIIVGIYFLIPQKLKYIWLLVTSYYFVASFSTQEDKYLGVKSLFMLIVCTMISYIFALWMKKQEDPRKKKNIFRAGIISDLLILLFFKYFDFILLNVNSFLGIFRMKELHNPINILLPLGISYYIFQTIGYMADVYKDKAEPEKNLLRYALFIGFFPKFSQGPIERSTNLMKQIREMEERRLWDYEKIVSGVCLMAWGMFQKMVIADRCAVYVDAVHNNLFSAGTVETVSAAILFSICIYCDFAGYSSIAVGAARVMGFSLTDNFDTPYFATSIADFWHRWHISLSTWLRDYIYIPLGGSRCSKIKKYRNIMITFLLSGLWHGASWTYVLWGGIHGLYQVIGDLLKPVREKINTRFHVKTEAFSYTFGKILITFGLTTFAWIFFKVESFENLVLYFNRMFTRFNPWVLSASGLDYLGVNLKDVALVAVFLLIFFVGEIARYVCKTDMGTFLTAQNIWFRGGVLLLLILMILVFGEYGINFDSKQFLYMKY